MMACIDIKRDNGSIRSITVHGDMMSISDIYDLIDCDESNGDSPFLKMMDEHLAPFRDGECMHWALTREWIYRAYAQEDLKVCVAFDEALKAHDFDITGNDITECNHGYDCPIEAAKDFCFNKHQMLVMQVLFPKPTKHRLVIDILPDERDTFAVDDIIQYMKISEDRKFSYWLMKKSTKDLIENMMAIQGMKRRDALLHLNANVRPRKSSRIHISLAGHFMIWLANGDTELIKLAQEAYESMQESYVASLKNRNPTIPDKERVYVLSSPALAARGYFGLSDEACIRLCVYRKIDVMNATAFIHRLSVSFSHFVTEDLNCDYCNTWLRIPWNMLDAELEHLSDDDDRAHARQLANMAKWSHQQPADIDWVAGMPETWDADDVV